MATVEKETPAKKAAAPSVSQINAEYVTQVNNVHATRHTWPTSGEKFFILFFLMEIQTRKQQNMYFVTFSFTGHLAVHHMCEFTMFVLQYLLLYMVFLLSVGEQILGSSRQE